MDRQEQIGAELPRDLGSLFEHQETIVVARKGDSNSTLAVTCLALVSSA